MSWAQSVKEALRRGEEATVRPPGDSTGGVVEAGRTVTLVPADPARLKVGDIVLASAKGSDYLHLVKAVDRGTFLIGDSRGGIAGWVEGSAVHGVVIKSEGPASADGEA